MTKNWMNFWSSVDNTSEFKKLAAIFDYIPEYVGRNVLNQLNARKENIIAEFGCGGGELLSFINGNDSDRTVGVDFAEHYVKNNLSKNSLLLHNDVFNVELKNESVDRAFCYSLFNYLNLDEAVATLEEMLRVTKIGGFVLCGNIIKKEYSDIMQMKLNGIRCPQIDMDFSANILANMAESAISQKSKYLVYDNEILGYENSKMTSNLLIWKQ
jgi:ubiquinone/menaquinone biosynthesis C-methylase UbiE